MNEFLRQPKGTQPVRRVHILPVEPVLILWKATRILHVVKQLPEGEISASAVHISASNRQSARLPEPYGFTCFSFFDNKKYTSPFRFVAMSPPPPSIFYEPTTSFSKTTLVLNRTRV